MTQSKEEKLHKPYCENCGGEFVGECYCSNPPTEQEYSKRDHQHCFDKKNPPCGQKIKHFQCCLCETLHPDIRQELSQAITRERKRIVEVIEGMKFSPEQFINLARSKGVTLHNERIAYDQALKDIINTIEK